MYNRNLRAALLGSGAAVAMMAASAPVAADEMQDLKAQIEALQVQLDSLESRQAVSDSRGTVAPAAAVEAGSKPKSWLLPGTNTSMNIGGYAKLDLIYDFGPDVGDSFSFSGLPVRLTAAGARQNVFRLHAKQSRVWFKTWTPTDWGELATHIEGDFEGAGGNQVISNSTTFRIRHAYGQLGPVLADQTWTNFMAIATLPETIDFGGPAGEAFIRAPQIRYTHSFGGGTTLAVSVENPESSGANYGAESLGGTSIDHAPDFTAHLTYKHSKGHVAARGVVRYIAVDNGGVSPATSDEAVAWGVGLDGVYVITDMDAVGAEFNYGKGLGRYMVNSAGAAASVTGGGGLGTNLNTQTAFGGYGWYQHKWTDTIRSNVVFGASNVENDVVRLGAATAAGLFERAYTAHGNVIWSPVSQVNFGIEVMWADVARVAVPDNDTVRIQVGMQYKF